MAIPRFTDFLPAATDSLGPALLTPSALGAVTSLATAVPRVMSSFGFECRLHGDDDAVDIGFSIEPGNGGAAVLAGAVADDRITWATNRHDAWRRLQAFAVQWCVADSPTHMWVPFIFLEIDAAAAAASVPVPSVFVALDWPLQPRSDARPAETCAPVFAVARDVLCRLHGAPLSSATTRRLRDCFEALPPGGWISHVAAMLSRVPAAPRLSVDLRRASLRGYLEALGWMHWSHDLEAILALLAEDQRSVQVDFDVGERIGPKLGVLLSTLERPDVASLLDRIVAAGWCTAAKRDAVLQWPGTVMAPSAVGAPSWMLQRYVSHVKVSYAPDGRCEAKAYLMVRPRPLRDPMPRIRGRTPRASGADRVPVAGE